MANTQISNKKLKAIVFTDIVDFTKLSAEDEQHALNLIDKQREIVKPIVEKHNGEWLKEIGDGLLFSFDSSLDAVNCSIEIQQSLKDIEDFKIRIGIHQGDIFIKDGDVFGDDVNIASRVEGFAPEGGISISDKVYKDIQGVKDIKTSFIGHKPLKGVSQEIKVRCITSHSLPHHNISIFPKLAYYWSFVLALLIFLVLIPIGTNVTLNGTWNEKVNVTSNVDLFISVFSKGLIFTLLGYTCLSYVRGISHKAQKFTVYFTYLYISYFLLEEFIIPYYVESIEDFTMDILLLLAMLIVSASIVINQYKKR